MKTVVTLEREISDGWGWEVLVTNDGETLAHTDVGYFDLDEWLAEQLGKDAKFTVVNKTELS